MLCQVSPEMEIDSHEDLHFLSITNLMLSSDTRFSSSDTRSHCSLFSQDHVF